MCEAFKNWKAQNLKTFIHFQKSFKKQKWLRWQNLYYVSRTKMMCVFSHVRLFVTPWTVARQAPPSMEFSRQEYWSGLPFPSPGNLPDPRIEPRSPALQVDSLPAEPQGKPDLREMATKYRLCLEPDSNTPGVKCHLLRQLGRLGDGWCNVGAYGNSHCFSSQVAEAWECFKIK